MRRAWLLLAALVLMAPGGMTGGGGIPNPGTAPTFSFAYPGTYAGFPVPYQGLPNKGAPGCYSPTLITGTKGEALTFVRATASSCPTTADESTLQQCASGEACITQTTTTDQPSGTKSVGLRIFRAGNNDYLRSEELDNASWSSAAGGGSLTVTADQATAPDGTLSADRLQFNFVSLECVRYQTVATSAATCVISGWVKGNGQNGTIDVGIATGGAYSQTRCDYTSTTWKRCTHVGSCAAASSFPYFGCETQGGVTNHCTPMPDVFVWGAQIASDGMPYAAPYVKTTTAAVTRNAETALFTLTAPQQPASVAMTVTRNATAPVSGGTEYLMVRTAAGDYLAARSTTAATTTLVCAAAAATQTTTTLDGSDRVACFNSSAGIAACIDGTCTAVTGAPGISASGATVHIGYDPDNASWQVDGVVGNVCLDTDLARCR